MPKYMIPLQFPVENYIYAPDQNWAHWTSSPVWSQSVFIRNNPARKLKKVPDSIKKTSREHAERISAIGKKGHWPIGDLYHARLALIYVMSPSHAKVRDRVISSVMKHYPEYDWQRWIDEHEEKLMKKAMKSHRAAANPQGDPILLPTNAGPFLPDMFPYGIGGRPQALENPRKSDSKKSKSKSKPKSRARKNKYVPVK